MLKTIIAGILALLASTFGFHHSGVATAPTTPHAAQLAAADAPQQQYPADASTTPIYPPNPRTTTPYFQDLSSAGTPTPNNTTQQLSNLSSPQHPETQYAQRSTTLQYVTPAAASNKPVTTGELSGFLTAFRNVLLSLPTGASSPTPATPSAAFQSQLDALQHEIAQTNQINNLSNVTLSSPEIVSPSISGLSTSQVGEGSNLYFTNARVASYINSSSTIPTASGSLGSVLSWNGSQWAAVATSSLGFGSGGGGTWGSITGTLANQTDLQTALNGKLGSSTISSLTNNFVPKWTGSAFANSLIFDNGTQVGIGTSTPGSIFSIAGVGNWTAATTTYYATGGINLAGGCFAVAGNCLGLGNLAGLLAVNQGGTGATTFGQGWIYSTGGTAELAASTSPTVNYITATSTTATSTFAGNLSLGGSGYLSAGLGVGIENTATGTLALAPAANSTALTISGYEGSATTPPISVNGSTAFPEVQETTVSDNALISEPLNVGPGSQADIADFDGKQYIIYFTSDLHVHIAVRTLATNAIADYDTGFTLSSNDDHFVGTIGIDSNGYIHIVYGEHLNALIYKRSINPQDPSSWATGTMLGGAPEAAVQYPFFFKNPATGTLYFTMTSMDGTGDPSYQYFYVYNTTNQTWSAAPGTGTGGVLVDLSATPKVLYLNGPPKWNAAGTKLWFSWSELNPANNPYLDNEYLAYWNGTNFYNLSGTQQTAPLTTSYSASLNISHTLELSNLYSFSVDSNGVVHQPYTHLDSNGTPQVYVAETSTGSLVEHQLTFNAPSTMSFVMPDSVAYPVAYSVGATTYVLYPDGYGTERGIAVFASNNDWESSNKFYISQQYSPNWIFSPDLTRSDGVVSFLYENANDAAFGVTNEFVPITGTTLPDFGRLTIVDWVPSSVGGLLKGLPSSRSYSRREQKRGGGSSISI